MSKGYAIRVYNEDEAKQAIAAFKNAGYDFDKCSSVYRSEYDKYVIVGNTGQIEYSVGYYAESSSCTILNSIKDIPMKCRLAVGDIVKIKDWSWTFAFRNGKAYDHSQQDLLLDFRVMSIGENWPINSAIEPTQEIYRQNDMLLVAVNDSSFIVVANSKFKQYEKYWKEPPIKIGNNEVVVNPGKSIQVGCTIVDAETVNKILKEWVQD